MDESCLPIEILEHIFSLCVPWLRTDGVTPRIADSPCAYSWSRSPPHPLAFTEVCRRWHWVARTSPLLWSVVDLADVALTRHTVKSITGTFAPLKIVTGAPANKITLSHIEDTCAALASPNARLNISTIDVCLYPFVLSSLFTALTGPTLQSDFTLLTKLILRVPPMTMFSPTSINVNVNLDATIQDANSAPISLSISSLPIPNVRHLELDGVPVHWASVQNLKHLSLRGLVPDDLSPTLQDLRGILSRSRDTLEFCRLENVLLPTAGDDYHDTDTADGPVPLPRLHTLSISAAPSVTSSFLYSIQVPLTAQVQLYTLLRGSLASVLPPWFRIGSCVGVGANDVTSLRLCRHSAAFLRPHTTLARSGKRARNRYHPDTSSDWDSGDAIFSVSSASNVPLPMAILDSVSYPSSYASTNGSGVYSLLNLSSLTLGVGVLIDIPTASLHTFLTYGAVNLEELRIGYQCDLKGLLDGLAVEGKSKSDITKEGVMSVEYEEAKLPCPRLRVLSFNRPSDRWWNFASMWLDSVVDTVVRRSRVPAPSPLRVEFWRCHGVTDVKVCKVFEKYGAAIEGIGEVSVFE